LNKYEQTLDKIVPILFKFVKYIDYSDKEWLQDHFIFIEHLLILA